MLLLLLLSPLAACKRSLLLCGSIVKQQRPQAGVREGGGRHPVPPGGPCTDDSLAIPGAPGGEFVYFFTYVPFFVFTLFPSHAVGVRQ